MPVTDPAPVARPSEGLAASLRTHAVAGTDGADFSEGQAQGGGTPDEQQRAARITPAAEQAIAACLQRKRRLYESCSEPTYKAVYRRHSFSGKVRRVGYVIRGETPTYSPEEIDAMLREDHATLRDRAAAGAPLIASVD